MNLRASRIDNKNIVIEWDGNPGEKYTIFIDGNIVRENTTSKKHSILIDSHDEIRVLNVQTNDISSLKLEHDSQMMYDKLKGGLIDISSMSDDVSREFKKFIVENGTSGDLLKVNVDLLDNNFNTEARLVKSGDIISASSSDKNIYLPFSFSDKPQEVIMKTGDKLESMTYDNFDQSLVIDSNRYGFGESFVLGGRRVVLAKGSVVIVLEDSLPLSFPEEGVQSEITTDVGTVAFGSMMATSYIQIKNKESSGETSLSLHVYIYNPSTDERLHATQINKTIDNSLTVGQCTWKAVDTTSSLSDTLKYGPSEVSIQSISGSQINTSTVDSTGLSFSSDDSSIFFGTSSQFKLSYVNDKILVMYLDKNTGMYTVKTQFER